MRYVAGLYWVIRGNILCSVNRPFRLFTLVYEEHLDFMVKSRILRRDVRPFYGKFVEVIGLHDFSTVFCWHVTLSGLTPL